MLRLKATKTSLYKLVAKCAKLPGMRWVEFTKVPRRPDYFLKWHQEDGFAAAFFAVGWKGPFLSVEVHDIDGHQLFSTVYHLTVENLRERGMVENFLTADEKRQMEETAEPETEEDELEM